jgi:hypothetical protein
VPGSLNWPLNGSDTPILIGSVLVTASSSAAGASAASSSVAGAVAGASSTAGAAVGASAAGTTTWQAPKIKAKSSIVSNPGLKRFIVHSSAKQLLNYYYPAYQFGHRFHRFPQIFLYFLHNLCALRLCASRPCPMLNLSVNQILPEWLPRINRNFPGKDDKISALPRSFL